MDKLPVTMCGECKFPVRYCDCGEPKSKLCKLCGKIFPWTSEYFHYWNKSINKLHIYDKVCKIAYVMAWKHNKPFIKLTRPMGINRKRLMINAGRAINDFKKDLISTEELIKRITPFYKEKASPIVRGLRHKAGL